MKKIIKNRFSIVIALILGLNTACQDQLTQEPQQSLSPSASLSDFDGLVTALFGAYDEMQSVNWYGRDFLVYPEITADLVFLTTANSNRFVSDYQYLYAANDTQGHWDDAYSGILRVNTILDLIDDADVSVEADRQQVKGECLAIRALAHFDLVRVFGQPFTQASPTDLGIPVVTSVLDPGEEPARNTLQEVYNQIIADLDQAISIFPDDNGEGPFRFTKDAALALRAKVKLYSGDFAGASADASTVINSGRYNIMAASDYLTAWQTSDLGNEIFTLSFEAAETNGSDNWGSIYNPDSYGDIRPSVDIKNLLADDPNDVRNGLVYVGADGAEYQNKFLGSFGLPGLTSPKILRIEEVYLIRAEARAETGDTAGATADLNAIRINRNAAAFTDPGTTAGVIALVLDERARELSFEGHRSFDIFRRGLTENRDQELVNPALSVDAPTEFPPGGNTQFRVYPIPQAEVDVNDNMVQNAGF